MKADAATPTSVPEGLISGTHPRLGLLKDCGWTRAGTVRPQAGLRTCNFHARALARSRGTEFLAGQRGTLISGGQNAYSGAR